MLSRSWRLAYRSFLAHFLNLQTLSVAGVTFANGSDNISIYVPLFANSSWQNLLIILNVFFTLVGILCFTAYKLTHLRDLAQLLTRYGHNLVPVILIGLGAFILIESGVVSFITARVSLAWT
ncbi:cadmium resistance transporter [Microseira sp. BLCC-F43]|uniref:cadmium resistance transporter n=1 Tax=Microseira sp. BLCC-F43 TaxID=3153602 RepID=UPI0035BA079F